MGLAKRGSFADQIIGEVGGQQRRVAGRLLADRHIDGGVCQEARHEPDCGAHRIGGVEQSFLVFLQVAVVGHGQALQQGQQSDQISDDPARLAPRQFGNVRVLLLRH